MSPLLRMLRPRKRQFVCAARWCTILGVLLPGLSTAQQVRSTPFAERFQSIGKIRLETPAQRPIARISGAAMLPDGRVILADISEKNVRVFARSGALERVIGGPGQGPGEFRAPVAPRLDARGRLHVPDIGLMRISVFEFPAGHLEPRLVKTVSIANALRALYGFEVLTDGSYVMTGAGGTEGHALFVVDSTGTRRSSHVPVMNHRFDAKVPENLRQYVNTPTLTTDGALILVAHPAFDSLWTFDPRAGRTSATRIASSTFVPLRTPDPMPQTSAELRKWVSAQTLVSVVGSGNHTFAAVVRGVYFENTGGEVLHRDRSGQWTSYTGAPPILAVRGDTVLVLRSLDDPVTLERMVPRK